MTRHVVQMSRIRKAPDTAELKSEISADTILPTQFFSSRGPGTLKTGEHRLLLALLNDAVHCFCKYAGARSSWGRRLFHEADDWIMDANEPSMEAGQSPAFSFEYVCEALRLDAGYMRGGLRLWRDRHLQTRLTA